MKDSLIIPFDELSSLIIASDNSGGIGRKEKDSVNVPYEITAYFSFRVAVMECMAAGAIPLAVVFHNFCGENAWAELVKGVRRGMDEINIHLPITGSTESNMTMIQSALGILVIGKKANTSTCIKDHQGRRLAVIGKPLVGEEVMEQSEWIAPLSLFKWCLEQENVQVLPVGSKGIAYEWKLLVPEAEVVPSGMANQVDVFKSSGPSTCFIVAYPRNMESDIKKKCGRYFIGE